MTRDDIINHLGWSEFTDIDSQPDSLFSRIESLARKAEESEREACAKVCEDQASASMQASNKAKLVRDSESYRSAAIGAKFCIDRIRARSTP